MDSRNSRSYHKITRDECKKYIHSYICTHACVCAFSSVSFFLFSRRGGRDHDRLEEEAEDKELVADELNDESAAHSWPDHLDSQPACINKPGGLEMRDYQLEALNWLIRLHDQKLNGILADEM